MKSGDLIVFDKNCPFDYRKPEGIEMIYYWAHFTGYGASELLSKCHIQVNTVFHVAHHDMIIQKFQNLFETFMIRDEFFDMDSAQNLTSLLITFGRYITGSNIDEVYGKRIQIKKSLKYISENWASEIKVKDLADIEYMSVSRYRTIFKMALNMSPQEYISSIRLNRSCELLYQTNESISNISAMVGYPDQRYFSRIFTKKFGISPSDYRKKKFYQF